MLEAILDITVAQLCVGAILITTVVAAIIGLRRPPGNYKRDEGDGVIYGTIYLDKEVDDK